MQNKCLRIEAYLAKKKALLLVILGIVLLNAAYYNLTRYKAIPAIQCRKDASGFSYAKAKEFIYFYYYTRDFPLASLNKNPEFSKEAAHREIREQGKNLIMEYQHWSRLGENARIWAFLPNALMKGNPENPSIKLFNALTFTLSLIILYLGFWQLKKTLFGLVLILMINTTPFFLYETYSHQNIFGLLAAAFFMILGLNVYALFKKRKTYLNVLFIALSGIIIGLVSEFRNEFSIVILSLIFIGLLVKESKVAIKIILATIALGSFFASKSVIRTYFNNKFDSTLTLVEQAGGHPYRGGTISGHKVWHPIFCGLGDFDQKYGFECNDKVAYAYAVPLLQEEHGMDIKYSGKYHLDNYYDESKLYYIKFDEIPEYEQIIKEKVLYHIKSDPFWYIRILLKRILRTLSITIPIPFAGWGLIFLVYFFVKTKQWSHLNLLVVTMPLSATSIVVYAAEGSTYNSVFVYFVLAYFTLVIWNKTYWPLKSKKNP